jgi:hypothetical protein
MRTRWRLLSAALTRRRPFAATFSSSSSWPPKLESATGRARKRRRRMSAPKAARTAATTEEEPPTTSHPKGWRVLWPSPHEEPPSWMQSMRNLPRTKDFRRAWKEYKSTWAAGLRGDAPVEGEENDDTSEELDINTDKLRQNLSQNVTAARGEAQQLVERVSNRTGIRNQQDLRKFATDMMKLATDCLREFMAGYRQGRDQEVEKMMNEYFQEEDEKEATDEQQSIRKRRRKPKRVNLRQDNR